MVSSVCKDWSFMANYEFNFLNHIPIVWSLSVHVTPVFKSNQIFGNMLYCFIGRGRWGMCLFVCLCNELCWDKKNFGPGEITSKRPFLLLYWKDIETVGNKMVAYQKQVSKQK